jgi:hypothetical protein
MQILRILNNFGDLADPVIVHLSEKACAGLLMKERLSKLIKSQQIDKKLNKCEYD